ncbi:tetratricopeptide repeat protein [Candidatus Uabimicrobium sp. HlEnr_7]|uniref:tetratricopeptide repeat protein n=1 Tax=Candidatus Uabimicrobium helgolandensis TaxID=3095367 RepID=UPI003556C9E4
MEQKILKILNNKQAVLFCGAGISLDPPAGLPDWHKLRDYTLEAIASLDSHLQGKISILLEMEMIADSDKKGLTPEVVASEIANHSEGYFDSFASLNDGEPNANHYLAAASGFRYIFTTNFDTFIEQALQSKSVTFKVYCTEEDFDTFNDDENMVHLFKLHGCISKPKSITATVEQEAKGLCYSKRNVLRLLLQECYFLFWGYSGADFKIDIDYLQMLSVSEQAKGFFWDFYDEKVNSYVAQIAEIYGEKATISVGNIPKILSQVSKVEIQEYTEQERDDWQQQKNATLCAALEEWSKRYLQPQQACNMLGRLFLHSGKYLDALCCFERSFVLCKSLPAVEKIEALLNMGIVHRYCESYDEALHYFEKAKYITLQNNLFKETCHCLNNSGVVYGTRQEYDKALACFEEAKKIAVDNNYLKEEAANLNNIGAVCSKQQRYEQALNCYERAKKIAYDIGDKRSFAARLNNIAYVYVQRNEANKALENYREYEQVSRSLGDFEGLSTAYYNMAMLYTSLNKWNEAKKYNDLYQKCKKM